ncbi:MAG TPA: EF2563 family selenium-dependent molybdenum hydroxylase system protein [Deltaproteobacteria bacterium]|nr:EF2563 family selenium-dependent molybdenum hydroxylase system protein [Deltaproteobacteria bacterium]
MQDTGHTRSSISERLTLDALRLAPICVRGGGDIASGVAWRLHQCGFRVLITEIPKPMAVRRKVAFCEAVYDGHAEVEGVEALLIDEANDSRQVWDQGKIPLLVDPECEAARMIQPDVIVDAILAKRNIGTSLSDAPLVIALGPGFEAGKDAHFVVETNRGHYLGRLLTEGSAEPNTGVPGPIAGISADRVLRAPGRGIWQSEAEIGDMVRKGDTVGSVDGQPVKTLIDGVLRGLIRPGIPVTEGLKIGDIDPRGVTAYCYTISEKALAISGGVLEGILAFFMRNQK